LIILSILDRVQRVSNTPLQYMVDYRKRLRRIIFQVDLFPARASSADES
jgi:hypothetical protein